MCTKHTACVYIHTRVTVTKYEIPAEGTKKSLLMKNIPAFPFKCYGRKTTQSSIFWMEFGNRMEQGLRRLSSFFALQSETRLEHNRKPGAGMTLISETTKPVSCSFICSVIAEEPREHKEITQHVKEKSDTPTCWFIMSPTWQPPQSSSHFSLFFVKSVLKSINWNSNKQRKDQSV